jgi:hypothetical protein
MVSPRAGSETAEASEPRAGGARMSEGRSFVGTFSSVRSYEPLTLYRVQQLL